MFKSERLIGGYELRCRKLVDLSIEEIKWPLTIEGWTTHLEGNKNDFGDEQKDKKNKEEKRVSYVPFFLMQVVVDYAMKRQSLEFSRRYKEKGAMIISSELLEDWGSTVDSFLIKQKGKIIYIVLECLKRLSHGQSVEEIFNAIKIDEDEIPDVSTIICLYHSRGQELSNYLQLEQIQYTK